MIGDIDNRFRRTRIEKFPDYFVGGSGRNDGDYWKDLTSNYPPTTVQEIGPINWIDMTHDNYIGITASSRFTIYYENQVYKCFNKFKEGVFGGTFRGGEGGLLGIGGEKGDVRIFDIATKTELRAFKGGHGTSPVHRVHFSTDKKTLASFGDDKCVKLWDIPSSECVSNFLKEHTDYVRCGKASPTSSDIIISGSYDHTVKLWDRRSSDGKSNFTLDHGAPVEDLVVFPNGSLLATAGGHHVKVWDILAGGRLLTQFTPHSKTITSISFAKGNTKIVTASLDRQIKFTDTQNFRVDHSISFPTSLLSARVSQDDNLIIAGAVDGLVQFMKRQTPKTHDEIRRERLERNRKYLQFTDFKAMKGDIVVPEEHFDREPRYDMFLRKFEYSKALDQVLKSYVQKKHPEYTYSVLRELERRNGLRQALSGREEKSLSLILQFVVKNINEPRFSSLVLRVVDILIELYAGTFGNCTNTDNLFKQLKKRVEREARNMKTLMELQGALNMILTASKISEEPNLRVEEINFKKNKEKSSSVIKSIGLPTTFEKILLQSPQ